MQNHSEIAEFLWKIADLVKDDYEAKDYEDVILPFTLLRRLDCVLEQSREAVRKAAEKYRKTPDQTRDALLKKAAGQPFYNTSEYSLVDLLKFPNDIGQNFGKYLDGFSANVKDILFNFSGGEEKGLSPIYETLLRKRLLFKVTQAFADADLSPETVDKSSGRAVSTHCARWTWSRCRRAGPLDGTSWSSSRAAPRGRSMGRTCRQPWPRASQSSSERGLTPRTSTR
jgi:hypothetical protein